MTTTYRINPPNQGDYPWGSITCLKCNMTSHNKGDVDNKYCANCKLMHEEGRPRTSEDILNYYRKQQEE